MNLKRSIGDGFWCVLGNFNAIWRSDERLERLSRSQQSVREMGEFNNFVDNMELLDIPCSHG